MPTNRDRDGPHDREEELLKGLEGLVPPDEQPEEEEYVQTRALTDGARFTPRGSEQSMTAIVRTRHGPAFRVPERSGRRRRTRKFYHRHPFRVGRERWPLQLTFRCDDAKFLRSRPVANARHGMACRGSAVGQATDGAACVTAGRTAARLPQRDRPQPRARRMMRQYDLVERVKRIQPECRRSLARQGLRLRHDERHGSQTRASGDPCYSRIPSKSPRS